MSWRVKLDSIHDNYSRSEYHEESYARDKEIETHKFPSVGEAKEESRTVAFRGLTLLNNGNAIWHWRGGQEMLCVDCGSSTPCDDEVCSCCEGTCDCCERCDSCGQVTDGSVLCPACKPEECCEECDAELNENGECEECACEER